VNTAAEGATMSLSYVWGKKAILLWRPTEPGLMTPAAGYIFEWERRQVRSWREEAERQDVFEASHSVDEKIVSNVAGYLIDAAVA
jgi:hypothetical protein